MLLLLSPSWKQQLKRRDVGFDMAVDDGLPLVLSDPSRLEPMLGGLVDRCSRSLPPGSQLQLTLQPAGARLKLQLISHTPEQIASPTIEPMPQERLGPVLSWNTDTGSLQLSQTATRRLLESLGVESPSPGPRTHGVLPDRGTMLTGVKFPGLQGDQSGFTVLLSSRKGMPISRGQP